ncbi:hypothetical protein [uncultured Shimia sp.]|uniref:hypothetical protein n=1 Tax=uncultured Shimia sp. TaxID=573152 RepID=UPI00262997D1|nr:hypothetical protein [uncultured Shimia sp.]
MKTVKNLLLAMVNATLILIVLALFLIWQISNTAERVAGNFAENLDVLKPVTSGVGDLQTEVAALRADVAALATGSQVGLGQRRAEIDRRLGALDLKLEGFNSSLAQIAETPDRLMEAAIETAADKAASTIIDMRNCQKPEA